MDAIAIGRQLKFPRSINCVVMTDGDQAVIPAGESVTVKRHEESRQGLLCDWKGIDVFLFREDLAHASD